MTGSEVLALGILEGPEVGEALKMADKLGREGLAKKDIEDVILQAFKIIKLPKLKILDEGYLPAKWAMPDPKTIVEITNWKSVWDNMHNMSRIPVVTASAVMPDACPAGPGITVGGVIEVENAIIPSGHSADICCSMYTTLFESEKNAKEIMDNVVAHTHFGPGGRPISLDFRFRFPESNPFLRGLGDAAQHHLGTQGDGNHFASLGRFTVTHEFKEVFDKFGDLIVGRTVWALTTHHGSRGFGAEVFKRGQKAAEKYTDKVAVNIPKYAAWLSMDTEEGQLYWEALETINAWTIQNHKVIHENALDSLRARNRHTLFNEHNFIWKKETDAPWDSPIYVHGKGATPVGEGSIGIIPLNMAEPILIVKGTGNNYLDFAPHGAGRNESRTAVNKRYEHLGDSRGISPRDAQAIVEEQTRGLDIRWFNGRPDITESPLAYKSASYIIDSIEHFGLCEIVGRIEPVASLMAGMGDYNWRRKKKNNAGRNEKSSKEGGKTEEGQNEEVLQGISHTRVEEEVD